MTDQRQRNEKDVRLGPLAGERFGVAMEAKLLAVFTAGLSALSPLGENW
jgi:hypothetical protein